MIDTTRQHSTNGKSDPRVNQQSAPVPYDTEAERAVLAACLSMPEKLLEVAPLLDACDFYLDKHATLYGVLLGLHNKREKIDVISVAGRLAELAGPVDHTALSELYAGGYARGPHAVTYARLVQKTAAQRRMIDVGGRIGGLGYDRERELEDVLSEAERLLSTARPKSTGVESTLATAMDGVLDYLDSDQDDAGVTSGFPTLDLLTSRWQAEDLILLAARPANGKSSMALEFALAAAANGVPVQLFSLEMSARQIGMRALARLAGVDLQRIRTRTLTNDQMSAVTACHAERRAIAERIHVDPAGDQSIGKIRAAMRLGRHKYGAGLVILDYLQLVEGVRKSRSDNQNNEVASVTKGLKQEARALGIPVIALSQMSRDVERRSGHRPLLSDLRDSGALEQDADVVMFIHRPELYETDLKAKADLAGKAELIIAKQRNGSEGSVSLRWRGEYTRFEEV